MPPTPPRPSAPEHPGHPAGPASLSPRERLVLRSLDREGTLAQIAAELFVSHNTLKTQVRSVYRKLGVTRRADAVAAAHRLRLG